MRQEVLDLYQMGPLPDSNASEETFEDYDRLLKSISPPISDEEAQLLVKMFGPDESYGMAWTLVHLIESAPSWPLAECLTDTSNEWISLLRSRAQL